MPDAFQGSRGRKTKHFKKFMLNPPEVLEEPPAKTEKEPPMTPIDAAPIQFEIIEEDESGARKDKKVVNGEGFKKPPPGVKVQPLENVKIIEVSGKDEL